MGGLVMTASNVVNEVVAVVPSDWKTSPSGTGWVRCEVSLGSASLVLKLSLDTHVVDCEVCSPADSSTRLGWTLRLSFGDPHPDPLDNVLCARGDF